MKLLRQVARQPLSLHKELIIVDDFSTDGTREFLRDMDLQEVLGRRREHRKAGAAREEHGQGSGRSHRSGAVPPASWCSFRMPIWNTIRATIPR